MAAATNDLVIPITKITDADLDAILADAPAATTTIKSGVTGFPVFVTPSGRVYPHPPENFYRHWAVEFDADDNIYLRRRDHESEAEPSKEEQLAEAAR